MGDGSVGGCGAEGGRGWWGGWRGEFGGGGGKGWGDGGGGWVVEWGEGEEGGSEGEFDEDVEADEFVVGSMDWMGYYLLVRFFGCVVSRRLPGRI